MRKEGRLPDQPTEPTSARRLAGLPAFFLGLAAARSGAKPRANQASERQVDKAATTPSQPRPGLPRQGSFTL